MSHSQVNTASVMTETRGRAGKKEGNLLSPLYRPEFVSGQLLTEDDLDSLTVWADHKTKLSRLQMSTGIIEGLSLDATGSRMASLTITPGYGVDQNLQDILLDKPVDISALSLVAAAGTPSGVVDLSAETSVDATEAYDIEVDVFLTYREDARDARPLISRQTDARGHQCGFTRYLSGFDVVCRPATAEEDQAQSAEHQSWRTDFRASLKPLHDFMKQFGAEPDAGQQNNIVHWLEQTAQMVPPHKLPSVMTLIADAKEEVNMDQTDFSELVTEVLFLLVLDRQMQTIEQWKSGLTSSAVEQPGVLLGRLMIEVCPPESPVGDQETSASIILIDQTPPLRDAAKAGACPAASGRINIACDVIGGRSEEGEYALAQKRVQPGGMRAVNVTDVDNLNQLVSLLDYDPTASPWDKPLMIVANVLGLGERVVAFDQEVYPPGKFYDVSVDFGNSPLQAGETTRVNMVLRNTSRTVLTFDVVDASLPALNTMNMRLLPDAVFEKSVEYIAPTDLTKSDETCERMQDGNFLHSSVLSVSAYRDDGEVVPSQDYPYDVTILAPLDLLLTLRPRNSLFFPGEKNVIDVCAHNTGSANLSTGFNVTFRVEESGEIKEEVLHFNPRELLYGETEVIEVDWVARRDVTSVEIEAKSIGVSPDGREVRATATTKLIPETITRDFWHILRMIWIWLKLIFTFGRR